MGQTMGEQIQIKGYHKSKLDRANRILSSRSFPISTGSNQWLGDGIYFWDNIDNALWWNMNDYRDGAILTADLACDTDQFIDLDDPTQMCKIEEYADWIMEQTKGTDTSISFSDKIEARAFFCTLFKEAYSIQLMKHSFPKLEYNNAGFKTIHYRPQYCATSMDIISNIQCEALTMWGSIIGGEYANYYV